MSTVIARRVASTPVRTAAQTWERIVSLLAPDSNGSARAELAKAAGVACAAISSESTGDAPIVVWGGGPRVRLYCVFGQDAMTGDGVCEDALPISPTQGNWRMSIPCPAEDVKWSQDKLAGATSRISARAPDDEIPDEESKPAASSLSLNLEEFPQAMSTFTVGYTYAHTVTHVTTKMLLTVKEIIREIGLDPGKFCDDWESNERAISTWLGSRDLQRVVLEIYSPKTGKHVARWDLDIVYATVGDGSLWVDTAAIRYAIAKAGLVPSTCRYDIKLKNAPGRPDVPGWGACEFRSTEGMRRYAVGSTIGGTGLAAETAYWSR